MLSKAEVGIQFFSFSLKKKKTWMINIKLSNVTLEETQVSYD